jgi:nitrite reductase/ring-hydroxylating ferredoxin subunit
MLSQADTEALCRVGPGTLMGEFFRRFWLPAMLPYELPEPDCAPVRLRLLGEDLVVWLNTGDSLGVMQNACPHRGASMFFGRNEENGLRCVYHGWKFDATGACIDMPNEPAESNFKHKIKATAYPAAEWGGVIWIYMGPAHLQPELPQMEWCLVPPEHRFVKKWIQDCNYAQALEGEVDSSHISFLHREQLAPRQVPGRVTRGLSATDSSPVLTVQETEYGMTYGARRLSEDGRYYWRVTQLMLPNYSLIPSPERTGGGGHCWIPMDDEHTWGWGYMCDSEQPIRPERRAAMEAGKQLVAEAPAGSWWPTPNAGNDYRIDREVQKLGTFTGIAGIRHQDMAMVESMGSIYDRSKEHLGTTDLAVISIRKILLRLARDLAVGKEPYPATHGDLYRLRPIDAVDAEGEFGRLLAKRSAEAHIR